MVNRQYSQLKLGSILNYIIIVINAMVGLLYTPYMLRTMGQSEYGLYSLVSSIIAYLTILDLGMGNAIIRYTAKFRAEGKEEEQYEMFGMFFIVYLVVGIVAFIIGFILYLNVDAMFGKSMTDIELDRARIMMLILVLNISLTFPMSIFGSIITAYERFVFPRIVNIIRILLNTIIMVVLLHYGYRAIAMVVVQSIFNIATLVINYIYCRYNIKISQYFRRFNWSFLKEVAIYSFWIFLSVIVEKVYWGTGQLVLGAISGTIAVSVFAVAIQLQNMYMQFSTAISSVFLPKVTAMVARNSTDKELSDLFVRTGRIQYLVMCYILCVFIAYGKPFVILWAGYEYIESFYITLLFFLSFLVPLIQNIGIVVLQAKNQMKFRCLLYLAIAIVALFLEIVLAKIMGAIGCAIAISSAFIIGQGLIMNVYYKKCQHFDIGRFWIEIGKMTLVPALVTIFFSLLWGGESITSWGSLLLHMAVFSTIYLPLVFFYSMNKVERKLLTVPLTNILGEFKQVNK